MTKTVFNGERMFILTEGEFNKLLAGANEKLIGRKEIAELWKVALSTLSESPWLLPNFGRGKKSRRNEKWLASEVLETLKHDPKELHEAYICQCGEYLRS